MALTLLQIFQRHLDCFDFTKEPDWQTSAEARQLCNDRQREREQAANEYVSGIVTSYEKWPEDINEDVRELALSFQRILSKEERKAYQDAAGQFLLYVASALREHRVMQLSPVTRYMMGRSEKAMNVVSGLSGDEAKREYQSMKEQGFGYVLKIPTDAYPATYTVFGYKPQNNANSGSNGVGAGNTTDTKETPPAAKDEPKTPPNDIWLQGKPKDILDEAVNCGLAEKKDDSYYWIRRGKNGWQVGLYGYFCLSVCTHLGWLKGKDCNRVDWKKFQGVFINHDEILGTAKQVVHDVKKSNNIPLLCKKVDELIESVFGVENSLTVTE